MDVFGGIITSNSCLLISISSPLLNIFSVPIDAQFFGD